MKTFFAIPLLFAVTLNSCSKKDNPAVIPNDELKANKTSVTTSEAVTLEFSFNDPSAGVQPVVAKWSVSPSENVSMQQTYSLRSNTITFNKSGTYTIKTELRRIPCSAQVIGTPDLEGCFNQAATLKVLTEVVTVN